ncbi:MAG: pyridoxamine 5'-phosphate oxidase family protein [Halioglobus sp.]|nr:pyridoxamine 5'-phosphate oxidase family protein [Halioglobus sp.]
MSIEEAAVANKVADPLLYFFYCLYLLSWGMPNSNSNIRRVRSLAETEITTLLVDLASPMRVASQSPNGFPLISTLWSIYEDGIFWCITQHGTLLRRNLAVNPRCAFEIALSGKRFKLLRGQGLASLDLTDGGRMTERIITRYLGDPNGPIAVSMREQVATEYAIAVEPRWVRGQGRR